MKEKSPIELLDPISMALGAETGVDVSLPATLDSAREVALARTELARLRKEAKTKARDVIHKNILEDYDVVRSNFLTIMDKGITALSFATDMANQAQTDKMYLALSSLIKSVSDANKDLLDVHEKMLKSQSTLFSDVEDDEKVTEDGTPEGGTTINNQMAIFTGSTEQLFRNLFPRDVL